MPRLVVRKTGKHIALQLINAKAVGDETVTSAYSSELRKKYGWLGGLDNLSAAYLTGLLCGYRAANKDIESAIFDIGLQSPSKGARIFAALKGFIDAGVEVASDEETFPDEKRITGQHIADYAGKIASDTEVYSRRFSAYLSRGLPPQDIPKHFSQVKEKIASEFSKSAKK
jgi:large subunit ribosomal protein L18